MQTNLERFISFYAEIVEIIMQLSANALKEACEDHDSDSAKRIDQKLTDINVITDILVKASDNIIREDNPSNRIASNDNQSFRELEAMAAVRYLANLDDISNTKFQIK